MENKKEFRSLFISGHCGTGKSVYLKEHIDALLATKDKFQMVIFDPKQVEFHAYGKRRNKRIKVVIDDYLDVMNELVNREDKSVPLHIFIDEYLELQSKKMNKLISSLLDQIEEGYPISIWIASQMKSALPKEIRKRFDAVIRINNSPLEYKEMSTYNINKKENK